MVEFVILFQVVPPCGGHRRAPALEIQIQGFKSCPRVGGIFWPRNLPANSKRFKSCPRVGGIISSWS